MRARHVCRRLTTALPSIPPSRRLMFESNPLGRMAGLGAVEAILCMPWPSIGSGLTPEPAPARAAEARPPSTAPQGAPQGRVGAGWAGSGTAAVSDSPAGSSPCGSDAPRGTVGAGARRAAGRAEAISRLWRGSGLQTLAIGLLPRASSNREMDGAAESWAIGAEARTRSRRRAGLTNGTGPAGCRAAFHSRPPPRPPAQRTRGQMLASTDGPGISL